MAWERKERHEVGSYVFYWFTDGETWLIAIWQERDEPSRPTVADFQTTLTVHRISKRENPNGSTRPVKNWCERFISDIPFRVRAIRNKVPTLRLLAKSGELLDTNEPPPSGDDST